MIAPDLRGYGDSDVSKEDVYDLAAWSRDLYLLVHDVLGHSGAAVSAATRRRYRLRSSPPLPGFVEKLVFFDSVPPFLFKEYAAAGIDVASIRGSATGRRPTTATGRA